MNARKIATTWGPRLVGLALGLLLAVLVTKDVRADVSMCNPYGIYIGADHKEAHDHFLGNKRGWGIQGVETDPENGITTVTYSQVFQNDIEGIIAIMGAEGRVIGIYTLIGVDADNESGMGEIAEILVNEVGKEISICGAEVSSFDDNGRKGYYAERSNGTATMYRIEHGEGVVAVTWTFGPADVISAMLMEVTK
jgi:hypothetical protein